MQKLSDHEVSSPKRDICNITPTPKTQETSSEKGWKDSESLRTRVTALWQLVMDSMGMLLPGILSHTAVCTKPAKTTPDDEPAHMEEKSHTASPNNEDLQGVHGYWGRENQHTSLS